LLTSPRISRRPKLVTSILSSTGLLLSNIIWCSVQGPQTREGWRGRALY
jgi:hypothetical protein